MNSFLPTPSPLPHQFYRPCLSPPRSMSSQSSFTPSRKRKAEDEDPHADDGMSASPSSSPSTTPRLLPVHRSTKRIKSGLTGHPLVLSRLLETLDTESLRGVLRSVCEQHPSIGLEVMSTAPRPNVTSALGVLSRYESSLQASFPFGGNPSSDYAYNRVRQALLDLLDALADFTPHFLPPNESSTTQSLDFLDGATDMIHRLPNWQNFQNNFHKQNAYEEISKAWVLVIREAAKRAGGIQLQYGGWDQKLAKHNHEAQGKLQEAVNEMGLNLGWMGHQVQGQPSGIRGGSMTSVRQELLSGTYGANQPVRVGPW